MFSPAEQRTDPAWTHVVLHAASPEDEHIETDPDVLSDRNMLGFDHPRSEREVPIRGDAPVTLTGLSWKRAGQPDWQRHDLPGPVTHHAALEATAMDDDYPGDEDYGYDDEDEDDEESRARREEEEERDRAHDEAIARTRAALPYVPSPPEGELIDHVHHMHGLDARTTDLHHTPKGRERWHNSEHASHTWQVGRRAGEVPHQHDHLQGIPGERQWPAAFSLSEHTDFAGGTPGHGRFERVLSDPAASRPFAPLMPSQSSLHLPAVDGGVVAHFEDEATVVTAAGHTAAIDPSGGDDLTWNEIGERHPAIYGDPEIHGERAEGADGRLIGWAASQISQSKPRGAMAPRDSGRLLVYRREEVDPARIRRMHSGWDEDRVGEARERHARGDQMPPVVLVHRNSGYILADGEHRTEAAARDGRLVDAYVHYAGVSWPPYGRDRGSRR